MDILHSQLASLQRHLAFVSVEPIDWKFYVQASSWAFAIFESYLLFVHSTLNETLEFTLTFAFNTSKAPPVSTVFQNQAPCSARQPFY